MSKIKSIVKDQKVIVEIPIDEIVEASKNEDWLDVGWKSKNGLWLGESQSIIQDSNTHVSIVRTFIDNNLVRLDQEAVLDRDILEKLIGFEQNIGGDAYARRRISQLLGLFTLKN